LATRKGAVARLLIVSIVGALAAVVILRALDSSIESAGSAGAVSATSPIAARGADARSESTVTTAPTRVESELHAAPHAQSLEQRAAAVRNEMAERMALEGHDAYADGLVKSGLSRADSDAVVRRFLADVAACAFETARRQYAAQGADFAEFVAGAERVWSQESAAAGIRLDSVAMTDMPCVADAAQRAGIVLPADLVARYAARVPDVLSRDGPALPSVARPRWADAMEAAIRGHLASYPTLVLTRVYAQCGERGCFVVMDEPDVPIFDLEFDVFAERNGFDHAVVGGDERRRTIWLPR